MKEAGGEQADQAEKVFNNSTYLIIAMYNTY